MSNEHIEEIHDKQLQQQELAEFKRLFKRFTGCEARLSAEVEDLDENCVYLTDALASGRGRAQTKRHGGRVAHVEHAGLPSSFPRGYGPPNRG